MDTTATVQRFASALGAPDVLVLVAAMAVLLLIAYFAGRREKDTSDYFLGGRSVPWLVACLSFVATEISAVTIVGVPAAAYGENWHYLQFFIGSAAARIFIAFVFIPVFFRLNCTTIYEFLRHRFGSASQYGGSAFFFITRLLASGVRLYAAALGISIILNLPLLPTLLIFTVVSIVFIAFGGIKAVVWTGAFEALMFFAAGGAVAVWLVMHLKGGAPEAWTVAEQAGRLSLLNLKPTLSDPTTLWAASLNALFVGLAVFGTDQEMMQRLLTVKTRRSSQKALLGTIAAGLPLVALYLTVGTLLYVFYAQNPGLPRAETADKVLSHFVVNTLPIGLKGLVLAAIVLASIDSPLSSLSSSFVTDIYRPLIRRTASENHYLWVSRLGVVAFGTILCALAFACRSLVGVLWVAFQVFSVTGGATLGIFLFGMLTRRIANRSNVVAMVLSTLLVGYMLYLSKTGGLPIGWSWLIVIGTGTTFLFAWLLSAPKET